MGRPNRGRPKRPGRPFLAIAPSRPDEIRCLGRSRRLRASSVRRWPGGRRLLRLEDGGRDGPGAAIVEVARPDPGATPPGRPHLMARGARLRGPVVESFHVVPQEIGEWEELDRHASRLVGPCPRRRAPLRQPTPGLDQVHQDGLVGWIRVGKGDVARSTVDGPRLTSKAGMCSEEGMRQRDGEGRGRDEFRGQRTGQEAGEHSRGMGPQRGRAATESGGTHHRRYSAAEPQPSRKRLTTEDTEEDPSTRAVDRVPRVLPAASPQGRVNPGLAARRVEGMRSVG
jgi:hypothetical protein